MKCNCVIKFYYIKILIIAKIIGFWLILNSKVEQLLIRMSKYNILKFKQTNLDILNVNGL